MARRDYSEQLNSINDPNQGKAGDLMAQAGRITASGIETAGRAQATTLEQVGRAAGSAADLRGKADATDINVGTKDLMFLGTNVIEAGKGYMEAGLTKDIEDSLSRLDGFGSKAIAARQNVAAMPQEAAQTLVSLQEAYGGELPQGMVGDMLEEVSRYKDAQEQGILSRAEVLTRVSAAVKKYSAMMPGWASEFRKVGADLTGIDRLDVYGVHKALTQQSEVEKAHERAIAAQLELDKNIAEKLGIPLTAITPADRSIYMQNKQLALSAENIRNRVSVSNTTQEEVDKALGTSIVLETNAEIGNLALDLANLGRLHADPSKVMEAQQTGLLLSTKLSTSLVKLQGKIREMATPRAGQPSLSAPAAQKHIDDLRGVFETYQKAVTTTQGLNMFEAMVKTANNQVEVLWNTMLVGNPHMITLMKLDRSSELFRSWMTLGEEQFTRTWGQQTADAFKKALTSPALSQIHANLFGAVVSGQPVDLRAAAAVDPDTTRLVVKDLVVSVKEWAKDTTPSRNSQITWADAMAGFVNAYDPTKKLDADTAIDVLATPEVQTFVSKLPSDVKALAVGELVAKTDRAMRNYAAQIKDSVAEFNNPDRNAYARAGIKLQVVLNPMSGRLEVKDDTSGMQQNRAAFGSTPNGAATYGPGMAGWLVARPGQGGPLANSTNLSEHKERVVGLVEQLNKMSEVYTVAGRMLGPDNDSTVGGVRGAALNFINGVGVPKNEEVQPAAPQASSTLDSTRIQNAIRAAERSFSEAGMGRSEAGALGPFQFIETTAKRYGLKVDPAAGIDERRDEKKAGEAAVRYMTDLHRMFNGEIPKMAAAYNAGEGSVRDAVNKATALGDPTAWISFLPKPAETASYIRRFMERYGTTKPIKNG